LKWPRRLVLIAASIVVAFIFNVGRTFFLSTMASYKGMESLERLHDPAGFAVMIGCLAALWALSVVLARGGVQKMQPAAAFQTTFPSAMLVGVAAWLCVVEGGSEMWFYARERHVAVAPQWGIAWPSNSRTKDIPIPKAAADLLNYNEGRAIEWRDNAGRQWNLFFFKWLPGRTAALSVKIHRPDICLPASGFTSTGEPRFELLQVSGVSLPTRAYRFLGGADPVHVYYCYWDGTVFRDKQEMIEEDWTMRGRLNRVFSGRRERGAQTLELAVWGELDDASADAAAKSELSHLLVQQQ
ncbi:MAG: exosortase/archaeosortase family protein, partial [Chthoniobacterales bacterium]